MDRTQADAWISQLGGDLGIDELALDEAGVCSIALDEGAIIASLGYEPGRGTLHLMICLDEIVPAGAQLYELLSANFGWSQTDGGAFAVEPATGALVLQRRCSEHDMQLGGLYAVLAGMVAVAEHWARRLRPGGSAGDGADADEIDARFLSPGGRA